MKHPAQRSRCYLFSEMEPLTKIQCSNNGFIRKLCVMAYVASLDKLQLLFSEQGSLKLILIIYLLEL